MRTWDSCDYFAGPVHLFHERTYFSSNWLVPVYSSQWIGGLLTLAEAEEICKRWPALSPMREFYAEESEVRAWFLSCKDNAEAIRFCQSADFDAIHARMDSQLQTA